MIRKFALGIAAAITLGAAALAPTAASAGGFHHHHKHRHGVFFAPAPVIVGAPFVGAGCFQKRLIQTRKGLRWLTVNVCAF